MDFFTPDQVAHLSASTVRLDLLFEMQFKSGTGRYWNGNTDLMTGGQTWRPLHGRGSIDGLGYAGTGASESVTLTLSGVPDAATELLAAAIGETQDADQQLVSIFVQLFDADWQPAGSPIGLWWGFMQPPRVTRSAMSETEGAIQTISVTAENAFFNRSRPPHGRYTDRDQQRRSPGDPFFSFIGSLLFKTFNWPDF
ncbi:hypothetical protein [Aliihoeflea sp. PC F10.4]